jgi:hypothetical protein
VLSNELCFNGVEVTNAVIEGLVGQIGQPADWLSTRVLIDFSGLGLFQGTFRAGFYSSDLADQATNLHPSIESTVFLQ